MAAGAERLLDRARAGAARAYAPYSRFRVGAALEDGRGDVFVGCNVENASYGLSNCAERTAIYAAIAAGAVRPFSAIAVACLDAAGVGVETCSPCGACRQVMAEHLPADAPVYLDGARFLVGELLPHGFRLPLADGHVEPE